MMSSPFVVRGTSCGGREGWEEQRRGGGREQGRRRKEPEEDRNAYQQPPFPAEDERVRSDMARVGVLRVLRSFGESASSDSWT